MLIPISGHPLYALLGGEWKPSVGSDLSVDITIADASGRGRPYEDSLANNLDEVRVGLPHEFAAAVLDGFKLAACELPSGKLTVNCAAHGNASSCYSIFKHLAVVLVKLLSISDESPSREKLIELFPATFD
jgi:hypothetical protein